MKKLILTLTIFINVNFVFADPLMLVEKFANLQPIDLTDQNHILLEDESLADKVYYIQNPGKDPKRLPEELFNKNYTASSINGNFLFYKKSAASVRGSKQYETYVYETKSQKVIKRIFQDNSSPYQFKLSKNNWIVVENFNREFLLISPKGKIELKLDENYLSQNYADCIETIDYGNGNTEQIIACEIELLTDWSNKNQLLFAVSNSVRKLLVFDAKSKQLKEIQAPKNYIKTISSRRNKNFFSRKNTLITAVIKHLGGDSKNTSEQTEIKLLAFNIKKGKRIKRGKVSRQARSQLTASLIHIGGIPNISDLKKINIGKTFKVEHIAPQCLLVNSSGLNFDIYGLSVFNKKSFALMHVDDENTGKEARYLFKIDLNNIENVYCPTIDVEETCEQTGENVYVNEGGYEYTLPTFRCWLELFAKTPEGEPFSPLGRLLKFETQGGEFGSTENGHASVYVEYEANCGEVSITYPYNHHLYRSTEYIVHHDNCHSV